MSDSGYVYMHPHKYIHPKKKRKKKPIERQQIHLKKIDQKAKALPLGCINGNL
jgi:hypothetical protein